MDTSTENVLALLSDGEITLQGEFLWGSNYTFLVKLEDNQATAAGVYKPARGERPLWDFPPASLARREVAAFWVSEALNWHFVPPTVLRKDAPLGPGSVQLFIGHDPEYHYFNFSEEDLQRLRPVALFDLLINNADRKGSHILRDADGKLWLIDHGVSFHVEDKLRTVIWDFVDQPIPPELSTDLERFVRLMGVGEQSEFAVEIRKYLSPSEVKALTRRAEFLVKTGFFPSPDLHRRHYPWPQI